MNNHESFVRLQSTWPETTDYLRQIGQANNDLMVLRELAQRDSYETSLTWLDQLAVSVEDLTKQPHAVLVLQRLHQDGRKVSSASQVTDFEEVRLEHEEAWAEGQETTPEVLEGPFFDLPNAANQALWALPELQAQALAWALEVAKRHAFQGPALTLAQAMILFNVVQFLDQEPEQSPGWAAECLQSALSSGFFAKAANLQP